MTFTPKVWGDALRRLQNEIPDFAIDAWISPLAVKIDDDRLVLGCPTTFHRDRVRRHHVDVIERCWNAACRAALPAEEAPVAPTTGEDDGIPLASRVELLTLSEFSEAKGSAIDSGALLEQQDALEGHSKMRSVGVTTRARSVNGSDSHITSTSTSNLGAGAGAARALPTSSPAQSFTRGRPQRSRPGELRAVPGRGKRKSAPNARDDSRLLSNPGTAASTIAHTDNAAGVAGRPDGLGRAGRSLSQASSPSASPSSAQSPSRPPGRPKSDLGFDLEGSGAAGADPFSFETFIVGPCNALAREASLALARRRQSSLNQLYLGGASGMGKTHLARAAASEARRMVLATSHPSLPANRSYPMGPSSARHDPRVPRRVIYTTAEQFTSDFVSAMRHGRNDEWARRFRGPTELLVVEDIQTLAGRTKTQEELAHTISHVLDSGGRVLLTGDRAPRNMTGLEECLQTQVTRGFVAELDRPDPLVRRHILRAKSAAGGIHLPADCLDLVVDATGGGSSEAATMSGQARRQAGGSVRDLESVLIQVVTTASLLGRSIDLELTRDAIDLKSGASSNLEPAKLEVSEVVQIVAGFFGKRPEALASRSRRRDVLVPRQLAMYLAHRYTDASLTEIGRALGRDHPAVRNALTRVERQVLEHAPLRYQVEALSERIDRRLEASRA